MDPGELLKTAREEKGIKQEKLAKDLNINIRTIQRYENGQFPKFRDDSIKAIDEYLGTKIYDILYDKKVSHETLDPTERLIAEKEARRQDAERKANEYFQLNRELIGIIKDKLTDILVNSAESIDQLTEIGRTLRVGGIVERKSLDRLEHQPEGTNEKESDKLEIDAAVIDAELGKLENKRKKRTPGKQKP
jgi:transcriptional regulator with XRE-family HTH domain